MQTAMPAQSNAAQSCAWCGAPLHAAGSAPGVVRCDACGVATTSPWPTPEQLEAAYAGWYRPVSGRFSGLGDALLRATRGTLARKLDRVAPPGRVLDVGAGDGALLDALRRQGREALGVERESSRSDVTTQPIDQLEGPFAAAVFWHSLEHLERPREALAQAARLLTGGGVLVVALPNADSLQAKLFGDRWFALDLPRHLVHVPSAALRGAVAELGLEIETESHLRGGQVTFGWLHGLVGLLPGRPDLYDAIRRPEARRRPLSPMTRVALLAAAACLLPAALAAALVEAAVKRGGTVYLEARNA